ncbi:hypothetical protein SAMN05216403_1533 [Nitrosospira multiformis ATCC 25196]|uniref:Uncharacterized protein n=1 Tax=Nitrosospira multiformis (strain ATCC 25196 / NCIMB 11849 / C 71) TaxID=323848 RepID=A0A1H5YAS6_NITMU|nr:hypothetical protein SAMN05216403_1533 [Nitrosospira multiformis ATCC 25196]
MRNRSCLLPAFLPFICSPCPRPTLSLSQILCASAPGTAAVLLKAIELQSGLHGNKDFCCSKPKHDTGYKLREGIARGKKEFGDDTAMHPYTLYQARSRRPPAARSRFAGPSRRAPGPPARPRFAGPPCCAGGATGTSGTRKSDGTGATRLYEPEIQYGHNKKCVLTLRSLQAHYNNREIQ